MIDDALHYIQNAQEKYDAIVLDLTDPIMGNSSYKLYTKEFYEKLNKILNKDGGVVTQATSPSFSLDTFSGIYNTMKSVFRNVSASITYVPSFDGLWGFVYASNNKISLNELNAKAIDSLIAQRINGKLRFYDGETHTMLFSLPKNIRDRLSSETRISTESNPVTVPA